MTLPLVLFDGGWQWPLFVFASSVLFPTASVLSFADLRFQDNHCLRRRHRKYDYSMEWKRVLSFRCRHGHYRHYLLSSLPFGEMIRWPLCDDLRKHSPSYLALLWTHCRDNIFVHPFKLMTNTRPSAKDH